MGRFNSKDVWRPSDLFGEPLDEESPHPTFDKHFPSEIADENAARQGASVTEPAPESALGRVSDDTETKFGGFAI